MTEQPYQLLPPLSDDEYAALREDIAANGIRVPVDVDEHGQILDGHHRAAIAVELGVEYPTRLVAGLTENAKQDHALAVNLQRRTLTREQRRNLILAELRRTPGRSDRALGRLLGVDGKTVGAVRHEMDDAVQRQRAARIAEIRESALVDITGASLRETEGWARWVGAHRRDLARAMAAGHVTVAAAVETVIAATGCSRVCGHVPAQPPAAPRAEIPHVDPPGATIGPYRVHPVLALFPWVDPETFDGIAEDILLWGLRHPIVLTHDKATIVDGRIRYLACEAVGVDVAYTTLPADYTEDQTAGYILAINGTRSHWNRSQLAAFSVLCAEMRQRVTPGVTA